MSNNTNTPTTAVINIRAKQDGAVTFNGRVIGRIDFAGNGNWNATVHGKPVNEGVRAIEAERHGSMSAAMLWLAGRVLNR